MLKFQYNKTALQDLRHQLSVREKALPILKNKETALRQEIKHLQTAITKKIEAQENFLKQHENMAKLWVEFPEILTLKRVEQKRENIAGVKVSTFVRADFEIKDMHWFHQPLWLPSGVSLLEKIVSNDIEIMIEGKKLETIMQARRKTTQKVNLYEKIQIPAYTDAIIKIKRFIEDRENIQKAAQKMVKERQKEKEAAV